MIKITGLKSDYIPVKIISESDNIYLIRWDYQDIGDDLATWAEEMFYHKPDTSELQQIINEYYNVRTSNKIKKRFIWKDTPVWLSTENQQNYKAVYDFAVQTGGANLPVEFKFGTEQNPVYYHFYTIEELQEFYLAMQSHIHSCLQDGWRLKDAVDYSVYNIK